MSVHQNLKDYFYPTLVKCDILFIGGDFFHTLLSLDSLAGHTAVTIINELIQLAIEHDFLIRVVRGTYSHDRDQLRLFKARKADTEDRVKIHETVAVEHIEKYNIKVLYLPDDLPNDSIPEIHKYLADSQIKEVDFILGHGYFDHMLPHTMPHKPPNTYNYNTFADIVKGLILFGHVHTSSVYKNIIGGGSFDRTAHGEEESKGFYTISYNDNKCSYEFHKNLGASIFKSIDLTSIETQGTKVFKYVEDRISDLQTTYTGHAPIEVRLILKDRTLAQVIKSTLKDTYPEVRVKTTRPKDIEVHYTEEVQLELSDLPNITRDNLSALVHDHLRQEGSTLSESIITNIIGR